MRKKKILITGGAGFQGSNLCKYLNENRDYEITILSSHSERSKLNIERFGLGKFSSIIFGSITDLILVEKTVRDHDIVFHLASNIHVDESIKYPVRFFQNNVIGTVNILEACREHNIPIVHISSCEIYGGCRLCPKRDRCDRRINETCPQKPQSPYASSKAGAENAVFAYGQTYKIPFIIVRPFNVYGRGQRYGKRGAVIPVFTMRALKGEDIEIYGDGKQGRDFICIDDLVRAYDLIIYNFFNRPSLVRNKIFNVGSSRSVSINELAHKINNIAGNKSRIVHREGRRGEVDNFVSDNSKINSIGFFTRFDIGSGLAEYIQWFNENELVI